MRLLTLDHLKSEPPEVAFVPSKFIPFIGVAISGCLCLGAGAFASGVFPHGSIESGWLWGVVGIFLLWTVFACIAFVFALRSTFWICRARGESLWFRCSAKDDSLVVELKQAEVMWVEPVKLTFKWKYQRGGGEIKWYYFLDVGLTDAAAQTLEHFANDQKIAAEIREQIAPQSGVYNQPVRRVRAGVIRVNWDGMSPGLNAAGKYFSRWTEIRSMRHEELTND